MVSIDQVIDHIRNRSYMSGIDRDRTRVKSTGEVFTQDWMVRYGLDQIEKSDPLAFTDIDKTFCDPAAGDGQMLGELLIRKLERVFEKNQVITDQDFEQALKTIYGNDLMPDNVTLCQDRLLCGMEQFRHIVQKNITCNDAFKQYPISNTNFLDLFE